MIALRKILWNIELNIYMSCFLLFWGIRKKLKTMNFSSNKNG